MRELLHLEMVNSGGVIPLANMMRFCLLNNVSRKRENEYGFVVEDWVRVHNIYSNKYHGKFDTVVGHTAAFVSLIFDSLSDNAQVKRKWNDKVYGV